VTYPTSRSHRRGSADGYCVTISALSGTRTGRSAPETLSAARVVSGSVGE